MVFSDYPVFNINEGNLFLLCPIFNLEFELFIFIFGKFYKF